MMIKIKILFIFTNNKIITILNIIYKSELQIQVVPGNSVDDSGGCDGTVFLLPGSQEFQNHGILQKSCSTGCINELNDFCNVM